MFEAFVLLYRMLTPKQKIKMSILQVVFLFSAVVQVGGVASLAPFIAVVSNPNVIDSNQLLTYLYNYLGSASTTAFLIQYATLVAGFILFGNLIATIVLWLLIHFTVSIGAELQNRLYTNYITNEYIYFAGKNSANMIGNIADQIPRLVYMVLQPILTLISQGFIAIAIIAGLIYLDPILALIVAMVVVAIYAFIYLFLRKKMTTSGEIVSSVMKRKLALLNESIAGIKEVKLLNVERWYKEELNSNTVKGLHASAFIVLGGDLPKFIVETIIFIAILALAIYLIFTQGIDGSAMSSLSFYAMAGYKLLPAAQMVYKSISSIKANSNVIYTLSNELEESTKLLQAELVEEMNNPKHQGQRLNNKGYDIELSNIDFKYPSSKHGVLKNLNITIKENSMVSFVGGSGAGKSTVANLILGLLTPTKGSINIGGTKLIKANLRDWQRNIGYVPQNIFMIDDSIESNIAFGVPKEEVDLHRLVEAARKANILDFINEKSESFKYRVGENGNRLSGGQKQRVGIARALYHNPRVLVLDEATSALDGITERNILDEIYSLTKSMTVIMIAHRMSTIVKSDEIFLLSHGKVVANGMYDHLVETDLHFRKLVESSES